MIHLKNRQRGLFLLLLLSGFALGIILQFELIGIIIGGIGVITAVLWMTYDEEEMKKINAQGISKVEKDVQADR